MDRYTRAFVLSLQKKELTDHFIYRRLANRAAHPDNRRVLSKVAFDELTHYNFWKSITRKSLSPNYGKVYWYVFLSSVFGLSFGLKLMESGEEGDRRIYRDLQKKFPRVSEIIEDEERHEKAIFKLLYEDKLRYTNYMMLGLNDGLVEFTGVLAGLTFALQNNLLVALTGLIAGLAASLSMASSSYLSSREDGDLAKNPLKAALYTGCAYMFAILLMISPYVLFKNYLGALLLMLLVVIAIIAGFTYYISIVKNQVFRRRFAEMLGISLSVALVSFGVGWLLRMWLGVEV